MIKQQSQTERILEILSDGQPHPTTEIVRKAYNVRNQSICRLGARIYDLRQRGLDIETLPYRGVIFAYKLNLKTKWKTNKN